MSDTANNSNYHRWGHAALTVLITVLVSATMMLWAWKSVAVGLFDAPDARFIHVLALQAGIATLILPPLVLVRHFRRDRTVSAS